MLDSSQNVNQNDLFLAAQAYLGLGYSVIPVYGDSNLSRAKVAAIEWSSYQKAHASQSEFVDWFVQRGLGGLAIVTGQVSGLAVLDFDNAELATRFAQKFPTLLETRIVLSAGRKLPHYYYQLPRGLSVPSRQFVGVDFQAEGRYVVAPPTSVYGQAYAIKRGGMPLPLSFAQIEAILQFLADCGAEIGVSQKSSENHVFPLRSADVHRVSQVSVETKSLKPKSVVPATAFLREDALALYRYLSWKVGRNNALFEVCLRARDAGHPMACAMDWLADIHAGQSTMMGCLLETYEQRYREALATIQSVYSRAARPRANLSTGQLPNNIREAFLQMGLTCVVRVLDALYLQGVMGHQPMSEFSIKNKLSLQVGRHSILNALSAQYADGTPIFARVDPSPQPPSATPVADKDKGKINKKCILFIPTESDKNRRGRPSRRYIIPTVTEICAKLGVKRGFSDPLSIEDLCSPRKYREALHREFVKRRPGLYYRGWLASRLGISQRTSQRYDHTSFIESAPIYAEKPIFWQNLRDIPVGLTVRELRGTFLRDETGKRYPALLPIAIKLLKRGRRISYMRREANYYWVGDLPSAVVRYGKRPDWQEIEARQARVGQYMSAVQHKNQSEINNLRNKNETFPVSSVQNNDGPSYLHSKTSDITKFKRNVRPMLDERQAEGLAIRVQISVNGRAADHPTGQISVENARKMVEKYPQMMVERGLSIIQSRSNIQNPAGFLVSYLRSTHKMLAYG